MKKGISPMSNDDDSESLKSAVDVVFVFVIEIAGFVLPTIVIGWTQPSATPTSFEIFVHPNNATVSRTCDIVMEVVLLPQYIIVAVNVDRLWRRTSAVATSNIVWVGVQRHFLKLVFSQLSP
jgi:hypothetical protein